MLQQFAKTAKESMYLHNYSHMDVNCFKESGPAHQVGQYPRPKTPIPGFPAPWRGRGGGDVMAGRGAQTARLPLCWGRVLLKVWSRMPLVTPGLVGTLRWLLAVLRFALHWCPSLAPRRQRSRLGCHAQGTQDSLATEAPGEEGRPFGIVCSKQDGPFRGRTAQGLRGPGASLPLLAT